jgi:hypothetical protein
LISISLLLCSFTVWRCQDCRPTSHLSGKLLGKDVKVGDKVVVKEGDGDEFHATILTINGDDSFDVQYYAPNPIDLEGDEPGVELSVEAKFIWHAETTSAGGKKVSARGKRKQPVKQPAGGGGGAPSAKRKHSLHECEYECGFQGDKRTVESHARTCTANPEASSDEEELYSDSDHGEDPDMKSKKQQAQLDKYAAKIQRLSDAKVAQATALTDTQTALAAKQHAVQKTVAVNQQTDQAAAQVTAAQAAYQAAQATYQAAQASAQQADQATQIVAQQDEQADQATAQAVQATADADAEFEAALQAILADSDSEEDRY